MRSSILVGLLVMAGAAGPIAQTKITPSSPAAEGPPVWSRTLQMPDGRTFVSDGGMAIDAEVARPDKLPGTVVGPQSGALIARHFTAAYDEEVELRNLRTGPFKNTFATPKDVVLNGNYVNYLRGVVPSGQLRFRVKTGMEPIVVVASGKPIAVLMPVRR
jgi:hypothetical protein